MIGTLINTGSIVAGGVCGHLFGRLLKTRHQETLTMACGISTLFFSSIPLIVIELNSLSYFISLFLSSALSASAIASCIHLFFSLDMIPLCAPCQSKYLRQGAKIMQKQAHNPYFPLLSLPVRVHYLPLNTGSLFSVIPTEIPEIPI